MLEFRADTFSLPEITGKYYQLRTHVQNQPSLNGLGILLTFRLPDDGGYWPASSGSRYAVMKDLVAGPGVEWLDIEIEEIPNLPADFLKFIRAKGCSVLLSHHNFAGSYSLHGFQEILNRMLTFGPDMVKFAVTAGSLDDFKILLEFAAKLKSVKLPACAISMGKFGPASRIASPLAGAPLTYASLGDCPSAPGQVSAASLRKQLKQYMDEKYHYQNLSELIAQFCEK